MTKTHAPVYVETAAPMLGTPHPSDHPKAIELAQAIQDAAQKVSPVALPEPDSPEFDRVMAELYPGKRDAVDLAESVLAGDEDEDDDLETALTSIAEEEMLELPDGSIRISVTIEPEMASVLREWSNGAGVPLAEYIAQQVKVGLDAQVLGTSLA